MPMLVNTGSRFILIVILSILLLAGCSEQIDQNLKEAGQLINILPDSALHILQRLKPDYQEMPDEDKAMFGILYFQALNKNDLDLSPVEIIDFSIDYYLKKIIIENWLMDIFTNPGYINMKGSLVKQFFSY